MDLVEREGALAVLRAALDAARADSGQVLLVGAEAGGGKTSVVEAFLAALPGGVLVKRGWCDGLSTPRPLGPFLDMAGQELTVRLEAGATRTDVLGATFALVDDAGPLVMVIEDLHWADEATLDAVRFIARRISQTRTVLILTYRDDEVVDAHPAQELLGELGTNRAAQRLPLPPLTLDGVRTLIDGTGLDPAVVLETTGGNPFFVSEVRQASAQAVPPGVRDLVLARAARLAPEARCALEAAAVVGIRGEQALIDQVSLGPASGIDGCIRAGLLQATLGRVSFRHEITRQAIEDAIPPGRRRELHARALVALEGRPAPVALARLVAHAVEAGDEERIARYAVLAGEEAARARAHREAAAQYRRALQYLTLPAAARAPLWRACAYEHYLTGDMEAALPAAERAIELYREAGDRVQEGSAQRLVSRLHWFRSRRAEAAAALDEAIAILEGEDDQHELAWAYSARSQLAMLHGDNELAIADARRALALIGPDGDPELRGHALNNIGTARLAAGHADGIEDLRASLEIGLAHDHEEHIVRAFCNLVSMAVHQHRQDAADAWLAEAEAYYRDREADAWSLYIAGWKALLLLERGNLDEAEALATETRTHPRCPPVSQIAPLVAEALVRARRGTGDAGEPLAAALEMAHGSGGAMRISPVVCAMAEAAWLTGDEPRVAALEDVLPLARRYGDRYVATALVTWLTRLGATPAIADEELAEPGAAVLAGRHGEAAAYWEEAGATYQQALALIDAGDAAGLRTAIVLLDAMGAPAPAAIARARLRGLGAVVPMGPRRSTRENPAGLTAREVEVLELLAHGATDAEIAAQLVISVRTAGHHVSAILRKLDVPSRARAAALADEILEGRQPAAGR
jgi:DNA-binding CsgD family transcriptional regulator/tetratricopeptide (TPR) repeat protein